MTETLHPQLRPPDSAVIEAAIETGVEAGVGTGIEAGAEAGVEAGFETGAEAGVEAGFETGAEAGIEAGAAEPREAFLRLAEHRRPWCESAVNATDIAVMLEMDGINDAIAQATYGARDVRDLAEELLRATPTRSAARVFADDHPDSGRRTATRLMLRGILYATPGAFYIAIAAQLQSGWAGLAVIGATGTGWMSSQVIAFVAYRVTERSGPQATQLVLRRAIVASIPVAALVAAVGAEVVGTAAASVLAAQVLFASAAAVLLFHDADRTLACCAIPGAMVALSTALPWPALVSPAMSSHLGVAAALITASATACAAWLAHTALSPAGRLLHGRDVVGALPYVLYGLLCASALAFSMGPGILGLDGFPSEGRPALAVLPITVVMGYCELEMRRLRTACETSAATTTAMRAYRHRVHTNLLRLEIHVCIALAGATAVTTVAFWAATGQNEPLTGEILRAAGTVTLGCALATGLIGCAFARPLPTAAAFLGACALVTVVAFLAPPLAPLSALGYLVACLILLIALNLVAVPVLRNPFTVVG